MPDSYEQFLDLKDDLSEVELQTFKRLFLTNDGQFVLGRILEKCKFMEQCENERDMALNNFAKELLATIYWDDRKKGINIHYIIDFVRKKFLRRKE